MYYDIETIVVQSLKHGNAVLLKLKGKEPIACGIQNFVDKGDLKMVELKPETLYGKPIEETVIHIGEIETLQLLMAIYDDPMYVKLRRIKKTILNTVG